MEVSDKKFLLIFLLILLVASFLRLYALDLRPIHFDEGGGHAIGAQELFHHGTYTYNPDFHGPFLYHITALSFYLFGISDISLRLMQALFGIGTVLVLFPLRRYFSKESVLIVALLIAISPSLVYYSRFALHDSFFVFFTMASVVSLFLYDKTRKNIYAYLFAINLAFLFTVKENAYIFLAILVVYLGVEFLFYLSKGKKKLSIRIRKNILSMFDWIKNNKKMLIICLILFSLIFTTFYTSFFRFPNNLQIALTQPFIHWFKKSTEQSGFAQNYTFYLKILENYEFLIFFPAILGIFSVFIQNDKYTRFVFLFGLISLIVYLFIPYKEPNNVVHIVLPLAICVGMFFEILSKKVNKKIFNLIVVVFLLVACYSLYLSWKLSFVKYSDEDNYLVYVQTVDDIKPMLKLMKEITDRKGKDISITVDIPQTEYPLSWYFRDYTNVKYISEKVELPNDWTGIRWSGDGMMIWDKKESKSGNRSAMIDGRNGTDGEWRQKVSLKEDSKYKLGAWIKTQDIEVINAGKYAQCYIRTDLNDNPNRVIGETKPLNGTNDWIYVETEFTVEKNQNAVWITCNIGNWGWAKGIIWYDNISITRGGETYNYVQNPGFEDGDKIDKLLGPSIVIISESDGQTLQPVNGYTLNKFTLRPGVILATYIKEGLLI